MGRDVYDTLAKHLDNLPSGFPRTDSGAEMRILRKLFTPEDAELAVHLTLIPEEPRVIARRARTTVEEAGRRLEEMEKKCLARAIRKGDSLLYMAQPFLVGFWEGQVNKLSLDLVQDFEEYLPSWFDPKSWRKAAQLRTIPVNKSISVRNEVMLYERAEELVRAREKFAVSNCICRQEHHILGKGCNKPLESCLQFDFAAESVVRTGRGRASAVKRPWKSSTEQRRPDWCCSRPMPRMPFSSAPVAAAAAVYFGISSAILNRPVWCLAPFLRASPVTPARAVAPASSAVRWRLSILTIVRQL